MRNYSKVDNYLLKRCKSSRPKFGYKAIVSFGKVIGEFDETATELDHPLYVGSVCSVPSTMQNSTRDRADRWKTGQEEALFSMKFICCPILLRSQPIKGAVKRPDFLIGP